MTEYGPVTIWSVIIVIGVATYGLRLSFLYLFGRVGDVPPQAKRVLRYVPPAVLAALVAPALITIGPTVEATLLDERLIAGIVAGIVAWRTENMFATIAVGMIALWVVRFGVL